VNINKQLNRVRNYRTKSKGKTILKIQNNTKSSSFKRIIALGDKTIELLENYKNWQSELKRKLGKDYTNYDLKFCREDGYYYDPSTLVRHYEDYPRGTGQYWAQTQPIQLLV
jgi:Ni,Fe-hydrogenase I large subunit